MGVLDHSFEIPLFSLFALLLPCDDGKSSVGLIKDLIFLFVSLFWVWMQLLFILKIDTLSVILDSSSVSNCLNVINIYLYVMDV